MSHNAPRPSSVRETIQKQRGTKLTVMEEARHQFETRLRANGGKLVPLTAGGVLRPSPKEPEDDL